MNAAIHQFGEERNVWPEYHNVSELEALLIERKATLNNELTWITLERLILQKYSWGMPDDIRARFKRG